MDKNYKLYRATVEFDILVYAENPTRANFVAEHAIKNEVGNTDQPIAHLIEIKTLKDIPEDWRDSVPYRQERGDHTKTCKELISGG